MHLYVSGTLLSTLYSNPVWSWKLPYNLDTIISPILQMEKTEASRSSNLSKIIELVNGRAPVEARQSSFTIIMHCLTTKILFIRSANIYSARDQ